MAKAAHSRLMTAAEAAEWIEAKIGAKVNANNLREWARRGVGGVKLPRRVVGGRVLFAESDVESWLETTESRA